MKVNQKVKIINCDLAGQEGRFVGMKFVSGIEIWIVNIDGLWQEFSPAYVEIVEEVENG